jgi:hypothetical protein
MTDRVRCYLAGILHGVAGVLIVGWTLSHWMTGLSGVFGPTGILSIALAPGFIVTGGLLAGVRREVGKPGGERRMT